MLRSRAITEAARMWASDALFGVIYTAEELGGAIDEEGRPAPAPPPAAAVTAPDVDHRGARARAGAGCGGMESLMDAAARLDTYEALLALWDANVATSRRSRRRSSRHS
ncbi:hypothetical protein GS532_22595 [Rhodococcus hoagii]|nr:hypothetical protein [Prescottella equi]